MANILNAICFAFLVTLAAFASAGEPVSAAAAYSTADTTVGDLLDNPATKAIIDKYLPDFTSAPQIDMARGMTLKSVQAFAPDTVTDDALGKIDAELAKLSPSK
jgi:hypothetical protein